MTDLDAEYPPCKECGSPATSHKKSCSRSIKDCFNPNHAAMEAALVIRDKKIERLRAALDDAVKTLDEMVPDMEQIALQERGPMIGPAGQRYERFLVGLNAARAVLAKTTS